MKNFFVSEQVQILLQRMKDRPEDFFPDESFGVRMGFEVTWESLVRKGRFNLIERFLINRRMHKIDRDRTKNAILEKLISKPVDPNDIIFSNTPTITIPSRAQRTLVDIKDDDTDARF